MEMPKATTPTIVMNNPCLTAHFLLFRMKNVPLVRAMRWGTLRGLAGERFAEAGPRRIRSPNRTGNPPYLKLASACASVSYTSNTSESFVTTKMFWIFLSTAQSFICASRLR